MQCVSTVSLIKLIDAYANDFEKGVGSVNNSLCTG